MAASPHRRLLLVSPRHEYRNLWALKEVAEIMGRKVSTVPLALPVVAALTPPSWDVRIVDEEIEDVPLRDRFDLVGITGLSTNIGRGFQIADTFRAAGIPVVMGGPYVSTRPDDALRHCDAVVIGEAEEVWAPLLADLQANRLQPRYQADRLPPGELVPTPRWDLVDTSKVLGLNVQVSRGCPHRCEFCLVHTMYGRRPRYRPIDAVIDEIRQAPLKNLSFVDDNLTANKPYARELMARIKPLDVQWSGLASLEVTRDPDLLRDMAEAGCMSLVLGFESLDPSGLAEAHKSQFRVDEYEAAVAALHKAGIHCIGAFVLGFDADTPQSYDRVRDFAARTGISYLMMNVLTVFDGTDLERRVSAEGRRIALPPQFLNGVFPTKVSEGMTEREVFDRFIDLMEQSYSWAELRHKAHVAFEPGGFNRKAPGSPPLWEKVQATGRLVSSFLFSGDPDKRGLFLDLVKMSRAGTMPMEFVAHYLLMVEALSSYVGRKLHDRDALWHQYESARAAAAQDVPAVS